MIGVYSRLTRWEDYTTFCQLVLGFVLAKQGIVGFEDWVYVLKVLAILAPLLYGGLYALNDTIDADRDKLHSIKRNRPIPSGQILRGTALKISLLLMTSAVGLSFLVDTKTVMIVFVFLLINLSYMFWFKRWVYWDIVFNTITHPLRFFYGWYIAGGVINYPMLLIYFLGVFNLSIFKRIREMAEEDVNTRTTLKKYSLKALRRLLVGCLVVLTCLTITTGGLARLIGIGWLGINLITIVGYYKIGTFRKWIGFAWR